MYKSIDEIIKTVKETSEIKSELITRTFAEVAEAIALKETAIPKMEIRVTGGTDMERLHVALAIEDALVGGRHFENVKFTPGIGDRYDINTKMLQWKDVYSELNQAVQRRPIAVRALRDIDEKNIIDRAIYTSEPVDQLVTQLKDTTRFLEAMEPLYNNPLATCLIEQNSELINTIEVDALCAFTDV